jgi:hypothetical protein
MRMTINGEKKNNIVGKWTTPFQKNLGKSKDAIIDDKSISSIVEVSY